MLNLDLSFTITAIIALISLISPILTAIINNWHDSKIRKLESKNRGYRATDLYIAFRCRLYFTRKKGLFFTEVALCWNISRTRFG